ncbi:6-phospho-beta-glucosidase [Sulfobacillus harzensis]|uniref:6-phospho-beta-glucosidase n=1 Tax=Sulfobacillus harzensis TaxID=2729629 RepID=A0A7Y0L316_9FIRM|nr:6-phospho-beta-glucosidase [Sulfobacillus harzensis]
MQLTILGGGGLRTPLFINGLAHANERQMFDRVVLFDNDTERIELLGRLNQYIVEQAGQPFELVYTDNTKEAFAGTDFVFAAIRVGQDRSRVIDERVALKYDVIGQETTGPGGFAMALRTIPVMIEYGKALKQYAPDAWFMNFTNPAGIITQALSTVDIKAVGICDSPSGMKRRLATFLGKDNRDVEVSYFGLNHLGWISRVLVDGKDQMPYIIDHYEELSANDAEFGCFDPELVRGLGLLPSEYLYYYYSNREAVRNIVSSGQTRGEQIEALNNALMIQLRELMPKKQYASALDAYTRTIGTRHQTYMQREFEGRVEGREDRAGEQVFSGGYEEVALGIISAVLQRDMAQLILNVPNNGAIGGISAGDVVEVPTMVTNNQLRPLAVGPLPPSVAGLVESVKQYERQTVAAATEGDYRLALDALAGHPLVPSFATAKKILDDYLREHGDFLPQF